MCNPAPSMSARCAQVLSPAVGVKSLRIVERVEGFVLQRFDERGGSVGDELFETLDDAKRHVYSAYDSVSDWHFCPEAGRPSTSPGTA